MSYKFQSRTYTDDGALMVTLAGNPIPANNTAFEGWALNSEGRAYVRLLHTERAPSAGRIHKSMKFSADGGLYVTTDSTPQPGDTVHESMRIRSDGAVYVSTLASKATTDTKTKGGRVSTTGKLYLDWDGLGFFAPLNDKGAGEVNTVLSIGVGDPTFTRATTATTRLSTGLLASVGSGVPRSYYLSDGTYAGYLAEGARTNLNLTSEDLRSAANGNPVGEWTNTDTTVTVAGTTAPDGANTGNLLVEGSAGTAGQIFSVTATADVNYAVSRFVKFNDVQWVRFQVQENATNFFRAWFDVQNGVVGTSSAGGTGALVSATMEAWGNGWYRVKLVGSVGNGVTAVVTVSSSANADNSTTRVADSERYEWGGQFENNVSFVSSYIPTTTAAVTRNADVLTYTFAGNALAATGAAYAELSTLWTDSGNGTMAVGFDTSLSGVLGEFSANASTRIRQYDGTTANSKASLTDMRTGVRKRISSWGALGQCLTGDGAAVATVAFDGAMPSTAIGIGCGTGGGTQWEGTLKNVRIWSRQLPDATLQALTA